MGKHARDTGHDGRPQGVILFNESSAPQPLSFTSREKAVVDRGFPAERWDSLRDALLAKDGPN